MSKIYLMLILIPLFSFANEFDNCGNNDEARALVKLIKNDNDQKRSIIRCNKILTETATSKAKKMSEFGLVMHNLGGSPNSRLEDANYKLPDNYDGDWEGNQVEAIAGGYHNAQAVWDAFKKSKSHKSHLLGDIEFYKEQDEIGVAFIQDFESVHDQYWVVYLTKGHEKDQPNNITVTKAINKN